MNRQMFGNLWARRTQLGHRLDALRHAHLWRDPERPKDARHSPADMQDAAHIEQDAAPLEPSGPNASTPQQSLGSIAQKEQALNTWEDEGGTTKPVTRR
jgi:hypothetical protein